MKVCGTCHHTNPDTTDFCQGCGVFLEWSDGGPLATAPAIRLPPAQAIPSVDLSAHPEARAALQEANQAAEEAESVRRRAEARALAETTSAFRLAEADVRRARELAEARAQAAAGAGTLAADDAAGTGRAEAEAAARAEAEREERRAAQRARKAREEAYRRARAESVAAQTVADEKAKRVSSLVARPAPPAPPPPPADIPAVPTDAAPGGAAAAAVPLAPPAPEGMAAPTTPPLSLGPEQAGDAGGVQIMARPPVEELPRARKPPPPSTPAEPVREGDVVCRECGSGNDADRNFCRRCGVAISEEAIRNTRRPSWWRRLFQRRAAALPELESAGSQVGSGLNLVGRTQDFIGTLSSFTVVAAGLAAVAGVGLSLGPWRTQVNHRISQVRMQIFPKPSYVKDVASTQPVLTDGYKDTVWHTAPGGHATFTFHSKVDLIKVGIEATGTNPPDHLTLVLHGERDYDCQVGFTKVTGFQAFTCKGRKVKTADLTVVDSSGGTKVDIAEVEFFERS
jgi:hypothetical protein